MSMVILVSSALFAGEMGYNTCSPENVTIPCENTAFDIGFQAIYVRPSYNGGLSYFGEVLVNNVLVGQQVNFKYDFGYRLDFSYHFNNGNDFNLNWTYIKKSKTFNNVLGTSLNVKWTPKFNIINAELGQHVDYGEVVNIRYFGGLQYANVVTDISSTFTNINPSINLKFNGIGPRAGVDMSYDLDYGFSVYSKTAAAMLVGESKYSANVSGLNPPTIQLSSGTNRTIVPELEAKVGLLYNYALYQGDIILDAGWMWTTYFSALQFGVGNNLNNFGFQGPYIGIKFIGGM